MQRIEKKEDSGENVDQGLSGTMDPVTIPTDFKRDGLHPRPATVPSVLQLPPIKLSKPPMTAAERSRKHYLKRREENPDLHQDYLVSKRGASKQKRKDFKQNATEEEKEAARAKIRERVAKCRQKKKEAYTCIHVSVTKNHKPKKTPTRSRTEQKELEAEREKDRNRKRLERETWSWQKKKAESLKAMQRRAKKV
ncbi:hypothetical protein EGW08_006835 [Elysia chlorotica]|uniref:Uncharacterized protein n=1 Tax=Elysia chlorotica TaxID=188477 RepID=A0A3S1BJP6_ELYCH|nr:hypothetical protein EGW08_006835 [Elysia chlorotica]